MAVKRLKIPLLFLIIYYYYYYYYYYLLFHSPDYGVFRIFGNVKVEIKVAAANIIIYFFTNLLFV